MAERHKCPSCGALFLVSRCEVYVDHLTLDHLTEQERTVLEARFSEDPPTLRALGQTLGLSPERIRQIEARAVRRAMNPPPPPKPGLEWAVGPPEPYSRRKNEGS